MEFGVTAAVVTAFLLVAVIWSRFLKGLDLDDVKMIPGEKVLYEEQGLRVDIRASHVRAHSRHPGSRVRVTNKRVLLGQKYLFGSKARLIASIYYRETAEEGRSADPDSFEYTRTWGRMVTDLARMEVTDGGASKITLPVETWGGAYGMAEQIILWSNNWHEYQRVFRSAANV